MIWSKFYLTPGAEYGQIQLFDNGDNTFYMVAVEVNVMSFPIQEDFLVMRVAGDGDVLSCRTYGNAESNEKGWGIIKIDANRYWLIGTGGADNHTDALLVQIDSSGNVMWSKVYDDGTYAADESSVTSYSYIPEYGLFVCGFDAFYNPFTFIIDLSDAFVFHVTDDGDLAGGKISEHMMPITGSYFSAWKLRTMADCCSPVRELPMVTMMAVSIGICM